jgi:PAS domain S-box-containing protein
VARRVKPHPPGQGGISLRNGVAAQYTAGVHAALRLPRLRLGPYLLNRELIQQTAYLVLVFRIMEGLAAWVLYNEVYLPTAPDAWPIHFVFLAYFVVNFLFCLRYHAGQVTTALVSADVVINLATMALAAAGTGGVTSPVVLISLFKIAAYGFVFAPRAGLLAVGVTLIGSLALALAEAWGLWNVGSVRLSPEAERQIEFVFRLAVLGIISVGSTWLFNEIAEKEKQVGTEARRAREAAVREHAAASVAGALLAVSEAVSRLTSLDDILDKVVDVAPRVLGVDYCGIFLWSDEDATYRGAAVSGVEPVLAQDLLHLRLTPAEVPDLEWVRRLGHCAVIAPQGSARLSVRGAPTLLTAPLLSGGQFWGVLQFGRRSSRADFTQQDLTIADGVASQTAVALERARLVEESHRLVRAVESTDEAVIITDRQRRIVFANQAFLQLFGYARNEVVGRDALALGGGGANEWLQEVERRILEKRWRGEVLARHRDGSTFPVALNTSLIRGEDRSVQGAVVIIDDISGKKKMQEQLQRADRLAAAGELAAGVAHEVNNALSGILGQAESARHGSDVESLRLALARVETQGRRIAEIVQGLLGFARPQPPQRDAVDLAALVRDTLALMAHDLGRNGVRTELRCSGDLPPVLADAKQIQQVLVNLFTNSMQAMEPRGGALIVSMQVEGNAVFVEVQDHGAGISPETLPRVFDPFFSTKAEGTGLGLSVSYAIVRAHGGDLTVRSAPGEGTTFTLRLPVAEAGASGVRSVLLVDDDPAVAESLIAMIRREGLTVRSAATGSEGLAILARETFDAIFLDVRLPDISGQEVYARLAAERPAMAQRVVFVTGGLWRVGSRGLRESLPMQPTLSKPCTAAQIRDVLRQVSAMNRQHSTEQWQPATEEAGGATAPETAI